MSWNKEFDFSAEQLEAITESPTVRLVVVGDKEITVRSVDGEVTVLFSGNQPKWDEKVGELKMLEGKIINLLKASPFTEVKPPKEKRVGSGCSMKGKEGFF